MLILFFLFIFKELIIIMFLFTLYISVTSLEILSTYFLTSSVIEHLIENHQLYINIICFYIPTYMLYLRIKLPCIFYK